MTVLVTGNQGYIGSVLVVQLINQGYLVKGLDIGYFADCGSDLVEPKFNQISKDIRDVTSEDLEKNHLH